MADNASSNSPTTEDAAAELAQLRADYAQALERIAVLQETLTARTDRLHYLEANRNDLLAACKEIENWAKVTRNDPAAHGIKDEIKSVYSVLRAAVAKVQS